MLQESQYGVILPEVREKTFASWMSRPEFKTVKTICMEYRMIQKKYSDTVYLLFLPSRPTQMVKIRINNQN